MNVFEKIKKMSRHKIVLLGLLSGLALATGCDKKGKVKSVKIVSKPAAAEVFIDGKKRGVTPLKFNQLLQGDYLLELRKKGFVTVYKNITLVKGDTREFKQTLEPVKGLLLVNSNPAGADLTVNDVFKGTTPVLITDLPLGSYSLHFKATGQLPRTVTTELKSRIPVNVLAELASNMAQLTVNSTPTNAEVRIDGNLVGKTPLVFDQIEAGEAEVMVSFKGYRSYMKKMKFEASKPYTLSTTLEALPAGLTLVSSPKDARVLLDGKFVGKTPLTISDIESGTHEVRIRLAGYAMQKKTLQLEPNAKESLEFSMVKDSGTLVVDTEPASVEIYVDGRRKITTLQKGASDALSQTARLLLKSKNPHKIQFVREGFISKEITVHAKIDEVVTKHIVLKRIFVYDTRITTDKEVIECRIEYKLPNGDIYYERYPGVFNTAKAAKIRKVEPISIDDVKNSAAFRLIEQNKQIAPTK